MSETPTLNNDSINIDDFSVSPNPAKDFVNFKFNQISSSQIIINVYSIQGKLVLKTNALIQNNKTQLDVSSLKSGMYFLKLNSGEKELTKKLIIN